MTPTGQGKRQLNCNFMYNRERQVEHLYNKQCNDLDNRSRTTPSYLVTEWYEDPGFIDYLFRKSGMTKGTYQMTHWQTT